MKVIAKTENGYLLEASENEVANLQNFYSSYTSGYNKPKIGSEIDVSSFYNRLMSFKSLITSNEYDTARHKLKKMLDTITPIEELIKETKLE